MTQKQRLKYSILIALAVLASMFGLSYLQNTGVISEKTFQYLAIAIAVVVVVIGLLGFALDAFARWLHQRWVHAG